MEILAAGIPELMVRFVQSFAEAGMKTRTEMMYDFMLALSSNSSLVPDFIESRDFAIEHEVANTIQKIASELVTKYLESI